MKQYIIAFDRKIVALSNIYAEQINDCVFNIDNADNIPDYLLQVLIKTRVMSEIGLSGLNPNIFSGITVLELKEFVKLSNINLLETNKHAIALIEITTY